MNELDDIRQNYRIRWLSGLCDLANLKLQKRWLNKKITNPAWTYVEFMCRYFDDCDLSAGYDDKIKDGLISLEEYECVKEFHNALDAYKEPKDCYDPDTILKDNEWLKIVLLGKVSLKKLSKIITAPEEKQVLQMKIYPLREGDFTWPN